MYETIVKQTYFTSAVCDYVQPTTSVYYYLDLHIYFINKFQLFLTFVYDFHDLNVFILGETF